MNDTNLNSPELYINRELSLLQFQWRVLAQAKDEAVPLLERLRFLCISSTNLDEFFQIRVSGLKHRIALRSASGGTTDITPEQSLHKISEEAHLLVEEQYRVLNEVLIPELAERDIHFLRRQQWNTKQSAWIKKYCTSDLMPVLSPLGLDPAHPFPRVVNKSLNFIISLEAKTPSGEIVELPSCRHHEYCPG